jgi:hypothetical protein
MLDIGGMADVSSIVDEYIVDEYIHQRKIVTYIFKEVANARQAS